MKKKRGERKRNSSLVRSSLNSFTTCPKSWGIKKREVGERAQRGMEAERERNGGAKIEEWRGKDRGMEGAKIEEWRGKDRGMEGQR